MNTIKIKISAVVVLTFILIAILSVIVQGIYNRNYYDSRQSEIKGTVAANIEKIGKLTSKMEQSAQNLAIAGSLFYNLKRRYPEENFDENIKDFLVESFTRFPEAIGGGIWFDETVFDPSQKLFGPYAYWDNNKVVFTWDLSRPDYDYLNQDWYLRALPKNWDRNVKREQTVYWTEPYLDDSGSNVLMITVDAFMRDDNGKILGLSTVDWALEDMLKFLNDTKVTPNSHTLMIDSDSGLILSYTLDPRLIMKDMKQITWADKIKSPKSGTIESIESQSIDGINNSIYYALTDNKMIYGIIVPENEIGAAANNLRTITLSVYLVLLLACVFVIYLTVSKLTDILAKPSNNREKGVKRTQISAKKTKNTPR